MGQVTVTGWATAPPTVTILSTTGWPSMAWAMFSTVLTLLTHTHQGDAAGGDGLAGDAVHQVLLVAGRVEGIGEVELHLGALHRGGEGSHSLLIVLFQGDDRPLGPQMVPDGPDRADDFRGVEFHDPAVRPQQGSHSMPLTMKISALQPSFRSVGNPAPPAPTTPAF